MIPNLTELPEQLGFTAELVPLALAVLLAGLVFLVQSVAQWSDERNP